MRKLAFLQTRIPAAFLAVPLVALLAGCAASGGAGVPAPGFVNLEVASVYVPLRQTTLMGERYGAGTIVAPGVVATNAHNANLVNEQDDLGRSPSGYDMMFFRSGEAITGGPPPLAMGEPELGQEVILYGQGAQGTLRMATGKVNLLGPSTFTILAFAGKGFSGGPVVDAKTGQLLGITYGFMDMESEGGGRAMYAFRISSVMAEYAALQEKESVKAAKGSAEESPPR